MLSNEMSKLMAEFCTVIELIAAKEGKDGNMVLYDIGVNIQKIRLFQAMEEK